MSCLLLASLDTSIANVALPTLAQAFNASFPQIQWVILAYLLATTTLIVSAGRLGDMLGRRRLLLAGILTFTVGSAACGFASSLAMLIAARAMQGVGAAFMTALAIAFVGDTVPKVMTGRAMGLLGTTSAVGTALGPSLGGILIASFDWRTIFFLHVPIGLLTSLLAWRALPEDDPGPPRRARFDTKGTLLLALTLSAYALAMTMGRGRLMLLAIAVTGAALFIAVETRVASPLIRLGIVRDRCMRNGFAMSILVTTVVMATLVVGPFYLSRTLALDAARVGLVLSCGPIVAALTGVPAGRIVDSLGAKRTTILGLLGMFGGSFGLATIPMRFGVGGYIAPLVVLTSGYAIFQAANNTAVMGGAAHDERGVVSGLLNLSRNLGLITGVAAMGAIFAFGGMQFTFIAAAALILIAIAVAPASGVPHGTESGGEARSKVIIRGVPPIAEIE